jgi:lipopolysaccharide/colanic/teichoic acid biosynthesis glycosyltransferase
MERLVMQLQSTIPDAAVMPPPPAIDVGIDKSEPSTIDTARGPAPSEAIDGSIAQQSEHVVAAALRRGVEIAVAVAALAVCWPVMLIVAAIVKLDSPGPAVFRQTRVGLGGRHFTFYKFRTLYVDARERFPELYAYKYTPEQIQSLQFKRDRDPRVTPAGRWLRKSTLDELPNFWNLLKGDVALVGPRPEIPEMVPHYVPAQLAKFSVKPGITGLAQTHGRGNLAFQRTIDYDLMYVRTRSVLLDIRIIFRTIRMLFDGAF